jgi:hypothetical protein
LLAIAQNRHPPRFFRGRVRHRSKSLLDHATWGDSVRSAGLSEISQPAQRGETTMGFLGSIGEAFMSGVGKVAEAATGGAIGKEISEALSKLGLPPAICNVMAMIGDPSYSTQAICEQIDEVGKALGLPDELTGALKKMVKKADECAKAFAQGGFGAVVCAIGKDLGLPPVLYEAIAAAVDAYTGNEAAAASHLLKMAAECAKYLGVPASALHIAELGADIVSGNGKAIAKDAVNVGLDVLDHVDMPPELRDGIDLVGHAYVGDSKACATDMLKLAVDVGNDLGLPPEAGALLNLAVGYETENNELMKAAGKQLAQDLVGRLDLPPALKLALAKGADAAVDHAGEIGEALKKVPDMIANLPDETKAGAQAVYGFITNLGTKDKTDDKDGPGLLASVGKLIDVAKSHLSPEQKQALDIATHVAKGDKAALQQDLKMLEQKAGDPKVIDAIKLILTNDQEGLRRLVNPPANDNDQEIVRKKLMVALRG